MAKKLPAADRVKIIADLYKSGLNIPETAQAAGVTEKTVRQYLSIAEVQMDEKTWDPDGIAARTWAAAWEAERRKWII